MPEPWASLWPGFLERLGRHKMSLAAYLAESRPVRVDDSTLTIGLPGFTLHQEVLSSDDNRRVIERLLAELSGQAVSVQYVKVSESAPAAPAVTSSPGGDSPMIQDIVNLFNATVIDQPSRPA